jgi:hypothetical protein
MTSRRLACLLVVVALVGASCSSRPEEDAGTTGAAEETETPADKTEARSKNKKPGAGKDRAAKGQRRQNSVTKGNSGKARSAGGKRKTKSRAGDDAGSGGTAAYPTAGDYNYRQSGYEEFCQATCERQDLPPRRPMSITLKNRSSDSGVVVNEARESDNRVVRTTVKFTPDKALITEVFTRFKQGNFSFSDTYHPKPPVESLRFPLQEGAAWSGSWKDKTSGDYSIKVLAREQVMVAGKTVDAFRIQTETTFRGQFDGKSKVFLWFDPDTKTVVKSDGMIDVESTFGRYRSDFQTLLNSGPGY